MLIATTVAPTHHGGVAVQAHTLAESGHRVIGTAHGLVGTSAAAGYDTTYDVPLPRPTSPRSIVRSIVAFRRICLAERPDVVWLHTSLAAAVGRVAVLTIPRHQRPLVAYLAYGFYFDSVNRSFSASVFRAIEWALSMVTDHLQTVSREDYERARRLPRRNASNTELTRGLGVDTDRAVDRAGRRAQARSELGLSDRDRAVFTVGALHAKKHVVDAVRAISAMGDGTRLFVVGDGPQREYLAWVGRSLPGPDPVFLGKREEVPGALAAADALVHPSASEGLPSVVLEAQAMGIPVVGARVRGTSDLLVGGAGILCPVGDVQGLAAGLRLVLDDPQRRDAVVAAGTRRAAQHDAELARIAALSIGHLLLGRTRAPA